MENSPNNSCRPCSCSGGVLIGVVSLVESCLKGTISIIVLFKGIPYIVFTKDRIHADIYLLLGIFGALCSIILIIGSLRKSSGKIIWWICFQGISIFHQIFFSVDVVYTIYKRVTSQYTITICIAVAIILLLYILLEIYFMSFIVDLYQTTAECEIENMPTRRRMTISSNTPARRVDILSDRNNPMQSSIIKLLAELEGNDTSGDTVQLIK